MDCKECRELIDRALADALEDTQIAEMRAHIDTCAQCAAAEAEMKDLIRELGQLDKDIQAPQGLMQSVKDTIRQESVPQKESEKNVKKGHLGAWKIAGIVAAALVVVVLGGSLVIGVLSAVFSGSRSAAAPAKEMYDMQSSYSLGGGYAADTAAVAEEEWVYSDEDYAEMPMEAPAATEAPAAEPEMGAGLEYRDEAANAEGTGEEYGLKIIRTAEVNTQSETFDEDVAEITDLVKKAGGFITSQQLSGAALQPGQSGYGRELYMIIRIPSGKLDEFLKSSEGVGTVQYANMYEEDVTDRYYDTDRRLKSYQTQYDRILALMEKAESVEDLITIESELNRINYEIESLTGSLKMWDSRVNYSTVEFYMNEVRRAAPVSYTLTERMQNAMADTLDSMSVGGQNFLVGLYGALPVLGILFLFVGGISLVIVLCVRKGRKKRKKEEQ